MADKRINWTPDEVMLVAVEVRANGWKAFDDRSEAAQRLSALLRAAPFHPVADRGEKFRNPSGVARKSSDIATRHPDYQGVPTNGSKVDREVLAHFLDDPDSAVAHANAIEVAIKSGLAAELVLEAEEDDVDEDAAAVEGRLLLSLHRKRERNPKLRAQKLRAVHKAGAPIACEVCHFDFGKTYGQIGEGYIEVHHVVPLHASGPTITKLADLALLCSNCHRMIHRVRPWLTPVQLRTRLH